MTVRKRIGVAMMIATVGALAVGFGGQFSIPGVSALVSTAMAYTNSTVSPVRVQNTARADWSGCIPSIGGC